MKQGKISPSTGRRLTTYTEHFWQGKKLNPLSASTGAMT
ncbi:MAG: hypothetical protein J7K54_04595 [Candidatus Aenigmarchaeota archaeon]|nr:hypothetical protein [Candidatus Aenigmarchaeota archaeon]